MAFKNARQRKAVMAKLRTFNFIIHPKFIPPPVVPFERKVISFLWKEEIKVKGENRTDARRKLQRKIKKRKGTLFEIKN